MGTLVWFGMGEENKRVTGGRRGLSTGSLQEWVVLLTPQQENPMQLTQEQRPAKAGSPPSCLSQLEGMHKDDLKCQPRPFP